MRIGWINQGLQLVSSSSDGAVSVWNIKKGVQLNSYVCHEDKIWAMDAHTDKIITGGADSTINIWKDTTEETK